MLDGKYIFDVTKTTLPITKEVIDSCLSTSPSFGYVFTNYENLITKLNEINKAKEIQVSLNIETIFQSINDPNTNTDVLIKIEGIKTDNNQFINTIVNSENDKSWTDFTTYSNFMKDDIVDIKTKIFKKFIWNYENVKNWFMNNDIKLQMYMMNEYSEKWDMFFKDVINTTDLITFINSCSDESKNKYINCLIKNTKKLLDKYKDEVIEHLLTSDHKEDFITLKNPIISKIYIVSNLYNRCKKEWPALNVISLSQRNFNTLGYYI